MSLIGAAGGFARGIHTPLPAGWAPDPTHRHEQRYWDGHHWTAWVADLGAQGQDPVDTGADAVEWWDRYGNPTIDALRQEVEAARAGVALDVYRAIDRTIIGDTVAHPRKVAELRDQLAAEEPDDGWLANASTVRRRLHAERLLQGTVAAVGWCKRCGRVGPVTVDDDTGIGFHCAPCGHGATMVRVVATGGVDAALADPAAADRKAWAAAERAATSARVQRVLEAARRRRGEAG